MNARPGSFVPALLLGLAIAGCAAMPKDNRSLEETRGLLRAAHANSQLTLLAPVELAQADDTFHLAESAWGTRDDVAVVDHLSYLARQRLAIAREVARKATADRAAAVARAELEASTALFAEPLRATHLER